MLSHDLRYFLKVAETANITLAARTLGISQPALSHALKRVESDLDVNLLVRSKKGVSLTKAGQRLAHEARVLLEQCEKLRSAIQDEQEQIAGTLRLGCHPSVAIYSLPLFLRSLLMKYPHLEIQMEHDLSRSIVQKILDWQIDFGIVINPVAHPELVIRQLGTDEVTLWKHATKEVPSVLLYDPNLIQTQELMRQLQKKKIQFERCMEVPNLEVIATLVEEGCGVGILPARVARTGRQTQVKKFSDVAPIYTDKICLVNRMGAQKHAAGEALRKAVVEAFS